MLQHLDKIFLEDKKFKGPDLKQFDLRLHVLQYLKKSSLKGKFYRPALKQFDLRLHVL